MGYIEIQDDEGDFVQLEHAGAGGACPDYGSRFDPCPPGCASGTCVYGVRNEAALAERDDYYSDDRRGDPSVVPADPVKACATRRALLSATSLSDFAAQRRDIDRQDDARHTHEIQARRQDGAR